MADIRFNEETLRYVSLFQRVTRSTVKDCLDTPEGIIFVVSQGEGGKAIGRGGKNVSRLKDTLNKDVHVIEYSPIPEQFLRNIFRSYKIKSVEIEKMEKGMHATVSVDAVQKGMAIGRDARNLRIAQELMSRHHKIDSVSIA
ncbi:MAG: NusA-like transcription termination signal-binding factor [Methanomassiliicoccales archaeon]|nr:MAG: NusA-like transcription termination signal-binding factor [Methanomassiliicoccales archaeon]